MKTIKYISTYILLLATVISCTKDDEMTIYNPANATSGTLSAIDSEYQLVKDQENEVFAEFKWTPSDFGFDAAIEYILEADVAGKDFKNAMEVFAVKKTLSSQVTVGTINSLVERLQKLYETEEGATQQVAFRLRSSISEAGQPLYSNVITSDITPYEGDPETMYMIGEQFGGWNWGGDVVEMIPVNDVEGDFWCIRYIEAGKGFKWAPEKDWNGKDFNSLGNSTGFTTADGNAFVASNGVYMIYISTTRDMMAIEPAKVYGIGDAFGGWEATPLLFDVVGDKVTYTTTGSGELRMYATSSIEEGDWWRREFVIFDGVIAYRGNGGDQDRVPVSAGQTITLDFNAGTGSIQ